jgi:ribosomal-protein-alanine N-acetyltransferase
MNRLRACALADVEAMAQLESRASAYPWSETQYREALLAGNQGWGLEQQDKLIGCALTMSVLDEAELLNLLIEPQQQGQGLGKTLLQYLMQQLRQQGIARLLLEVRASNQRARALYQHTGFRETGLRKHYYRSDDGREHAILMEAAL